MNALLTRPHDAPLRHPSFVLDWRGALRLLAGAALFGVIVGSLG